MIESLQQKNNTRLGVRVNFAFFGTSKFSVIILEELKSFGFLPSLIITTPDKPKGRKLILTPSEVKVWAIENNIKYIEPESLRLSKNPNIVEEIKSYSKQDFNPVVNFDMEQGSVHRTMPESTTGFDLFIVASYGKIIPQYILDIPSKQTLNVHPSLLPKLRGASPIQSAILTEDETGVTIMRIDVEMDHGPIVAQEKVDILNWPPYSSDLEKTLGKRGGKILAEILPKWIKGEIKETEQEHNKATLCKKIEKSDGEINLSDDPQKNLRKIRAYDIWPGAFFFQIHLDKKIRVNVKSAHIENEVLVIEKVVPEGKKEMSYDDFKKGLR